MSTGPTIGVLSTSFGGWYFGGVVGGIGRHLAKAGGRLIGIQTMDAGTYALDLRTAPRFKHPVAQDHLAGMMVLLNAVDREYLEGVRAAGLPIVLVSDNAADFPCPLVLPDNRSGVRETVEHLIGHGHRRIAFAGFPAQRDISERYAAYQDCLRTHGIEPDPALFYDTGNNQVDGGERAARAMIAAGLPSTAVVLGNDLNAFGLMRVLVGAGYDLPAQQAVVGFDDSQDVAYLTPSLSSVQQPLDEIGRMATDLILRQIAGEFIPPESFYVPTSLVARESCGCSSTLSITIAAGPGSASAEEAPAVQNIPAQLPEAELAARLAGVLATATVDPDDPPVRVALADSVQVLKATFDAVALGDPAPAAVDLRRSLAPLSRLVQHPEGLVQTLRSIAEYGYSLCQRVAAPDDLTALRRVEDCTRELTLALSQDQTRSYLARSTAVFETLSTQYAVSMELLRSHEHDPKSLGWLQLTNVRAGHLGLWPMRGLADQETLNLVGSFDRDRVGSDGPGRAESNVVVPVQAFPSLDLIELADLNDDLMVYVALLKVDSGDWGMLAVVEPIEAELLTGRETMNQWAALLSVSLEHEAVLQALREQEERLRRAALYDELTGLPNRALFRERLVQAMGRAARRPDYEYAVLMLDLDGFKLVNDSLGHLAGDRLLAEVANRISAELRVIDTSARFGGDEFAVLLEEVHGSAGAETFARRLLTILSATYDLGGQDVAVGASIGIAMGGPSYAGTEDLVRDADIAMYQAKSRQKGTVAVFDAGMHSTTVDRLKLENELRRAIDAREFELHYQPIVTLDSDRIHAVEALLRWRHPTRGLLAPGDFLAVAEESGLIVPIGGWVLFEACRQLVLWNAEPPLERRLQVNVNVSNRQFWHGDLLRDIEDCLALDGLQPGDLALELTEGVIMYDVRVARGLLGNLQALGVKLHIDDFGTGYSSLEALHDLPIHALKFDRSFVSRLGTDERSTELVRTILAMSHNLGLDVVAKGVETPAQLARLRELGCSHGQGYLFSRPVPADQLSALLRRSAVLAPAGRQALD